MLGGAEALGYSVSAAARPRPAAYSLYVSFFDWDMASPRKTFVYLDNYRRVVTDPIFHVSLVNTVVYVAATVVLDTVIGLALALTLHTHRRGREVYRFLVFLPVVTSITVITLIWLFLLNTQVAR